MRTDHRLELDEPGGRVEISVVRMRPDARAPGAVPAVALLHGVPPAAGVSGAPLEVGSRIAGEMGWDVALPDLRGCGDSRGDFSLGGWCRDIAAIVDLLAADDDVDGVWLAGTSVGGSLALLAAVDDDRVRGVATLGAPADFVDWVGNPRRFLDEVRRLGLVSGRTVAVEEWLREFRDLAPVEAARRLADRALLVVHGSDDDRVPAMDGRILADAHGTADLRIVHGAHHDLDRDPRALALLLGWLDRQSRRTAG